MIILTYKRKPDASPFFGASETQWFHIERFTDDNEAAARAAADRAARDGHREVYLSRAYAQYFVTHDVAVRDIK